MSGHGWVWWLLSGLAACVLMTSCGDATSGGGAQATAGAPSAADAAPGDAGSGGSSEVVCDDSPEDPVQTGCRLEPPTMMQCDEPDVSGWQGCYAGGCEVCKELLDAYPFYVKWHACCQVNRTCSNHSPLKCNSRCPAPTERDKYPPCRSLLR